MKKVLSAVLALAAMPAAAQPEPEFTWFSTALGSTRAQFEKVHGKPIRCEDAGNFCVHDKGDDMFRVLYLDGRVISVFWHVPKAMQRALSAEDVLPAENCSSPPEMPRVGSLAWRCAGGSAILELINDRQGATWAIKLAYPEATAESLRRDYQRQPRP